jgi:hypothetical protein
MRLCAQTGSHQGPHPHVHILPCPYYTWPWRADSPYSRGGRGVELGGDPGGDPIRGIGNPSWGLI